VTSRQAISVPDLQVTSLDIIRVTGVVLLGGGSLVAGGIADFPELVTQGLIAAGLTLILVGILIVIRSLVRIRARDVAAQVLTGFIERDVTPSFVTDDEGQVHASNNAADTRFSGSKSNTLSGTMRMLFANPTAVLYRLQCRANVDGSAREDIVTRNGHIRLAVHRLDGQGFLWRIEDIVDRGGQGRGADAIPVPMLTVGRSGAVLFMNEAARTLFG
jgi:two-component system cell cycle sensor histidine kinase/response regulator CckA